jgi:alpha,alpha-trehalase
MAALRTTDFDAGIFDLDGVVTRTAAVHAAAWKKLFDDYLAQRASASGSRHNPFDIETDYRQYVDGKPRYAGVQSFLESRGIQLPYGAPDHAPGRETICGLGNRKNELFRKLLAQSGVEVFQSAVSFIERLRQQGLKTAVVSSSKNAKDVLAIARVVDLFDVCIDGVEAARRKLAGKPQPDIFLEAVRALGVTPARAFAVEDALAGVEAARAAGVGLVIGIDRRGEGAALKARGADVVIGDLAELTLSPRHE